MCFSVLISVYHKENPVFFDQAIESVVEQTLLPGEIVVVKDGPLTTDLDEVLKKYVEKYPVLFKIVSLETNRGLGVALNAGLEHCSYELVARMDSDDICFENRFEKQIECFKNDKKLVLVGCYVKEFNRIPNDIDVIRRVPIKSDKIIKFSKVRNPFNHPSVVFNKEAVLESGAYKDMPYFEDYYLWLRMLKRGYKVKNIGEPLLYFRTGNDMIGRRHGWSYLRKETFFYRKCYEEDLLNKYTYIKSMFFRPPLRLLPKSLLNFLYKSLLRK